jgi:hypothetical protein
VEAIALLLAAAGTVTVVLATAIGAPRQGLGLMLELWTAGGLIRLTSEASWEKLAVAAAVIGLRKLVLWATRPGGGAIAPAPSVGRAEPP